MLDAALLKDIANQMMIGATVKVRGVRGKTLRVGRTSVQHLKTVTFTMDGREYQAIEQNPHKSGRWAALARAGHQVVQFKDVETNRFVAVAVDGEVKVYGQLGRRRGV